MAQQFAVTFDYLCPFARNAHEALVTALRSGADYDVRFVPFSLNQSHAGEGEPPVWEREPDSWGQGVTALLYGLAVRDAFPERFLDFHEAAFALRHDRDGRFDEASLDEVAASVDLDTAALKAEVWSGRPLAALAAEHTEMVERYDVFGVPTFVRGDAATFIRFMERGNTEALARAVDLLDWSNLNEFKRTRLPR